MSSGKGPRDHALALVHRFGWYVFRLHITHDPEACDGGMSSCKVFRTFDDERWSQVSTNDPDVVSSWDWSTVNGYGIDCGKSGLIVADEDPDSSWPFTGTRVHSTGRGRHHLYEDILGVGNRVKVAPWGIDIRGVGGMVAGPGSWHPHGSYSVLEDVEPANPPPALIEAAKTPILDHATIATEPLDQLEALPRLDGVYRRMEESQPGTLNDTLNKMAGTAAGIWSRLPDDDRVGMFSEHHIKRRLLDAVASVPHSFDERLSKATIDNGWTWGLDHPVTDPKEIAAVGWDRIFTATDRLSYIRRAAHSRGLPAPTVLTATLAELALQIPVHVVLPPTVGTEQVINVGFILLGDSAASKTTSAKLGRQLLGVGKRNPNWYGGLGSGEGLIDAFYRMVPVTGGNGRPAMEKQLAPIDDRRFMITVDEAEQVSALKQRSTVFSHLRSGIGGGTDLSNTNTLNSGNNRYVPEMTYRMVCLMGIHLDQSDLILDDVGNGFPQRFAWILADDPELPERWEDMPVMDVEPLGVAMPDFEPVGDAADLLDGDGLYRIDYPAHIAAEIKQRNLDKSRGMVDALEVHAPLVQLKMAFLLAVLHDETKITDQWWELARVMSEASTVAQRMCLERMGEKGREKAVSRVRVEREAVAEVSGGRMEKCVEKVVAKLREVPGERMGWMQVRPAHRVRVGLDTTEVLDELRGQAGIHVEETVSKRGTVAWELWFEG